MSECCRSLCIVSGHELNPTFGGVDRVSATLSDFFEARGIRVYHLATRRCFPERNLKENEFVIPLGSDDEKQKFCDSFFSSKNIQIAIIQGFTDCPKLPPSVKTISVFHGNPGLWNDSSITGHIDSSTKLARFPFYLLRPLLKLFVFRKILLRKFRALERVCFLQMLSHDRAVLLSRRFIPLFLKCIGIEKCPESLTAIPNPVPFPPQQKCVSGKKENRILFVGRLQNAQKRVDLLLKSWAMLEPVFPEWSLDIIGDGIDRAVLERLSKHLKLKRVCFHGHQNPVDFYKRSKIFTLTSECEGFGMVLVESATFGCVPVAFDSYAAVRDIIDDGVNGCLVPPFDVKKYSEVLALLIRNEDLLSRLSANAFGISEKFSVERVGAQWLALFDELLN